MAFGLDDALSAAAAGIRLTFTIVDVIERYRAQRKQPDLEVLLQQVRITALERIKDADAALAGFEKILVNRNVNLDMRLGDVIAKTSFWNAGESHRLKEYQKRFDEFADAIYRASDDIAALVRCQGATETMGVAIVESFGNKHAFNDRLTNAKSLKEGIGILRDQLARQEKALRG